MATFTVPVVLTTTGWITINANSLEEAKLIADKLDQDGVKLDQVEDPEFYSELELDELLEVVEE
jgi:hypothetical protein